MQFGTQDFIARRQSSIFPGELHHGMRIGNPVPRPHLESPLLLRLIVCTGEIRSGRIRFSVAIIAATINGSNSVPPNQRSFS